MQNNSEKNWPWPKELDALKAAPQHHQLLMENDAVRVINTCIHLARSPQCIHTNGLHLCM